MSNDNNLSVALNHPFPYEAYGVNFEGQAYVSVQWVVERLNEVVGPLNWRHEFFEVTENMEDFSVELLGRLSIWDEQKQTWMERTNYGNDVMTVFREATKPTVQDRMDCKKSAVSDSLKKCAAWFGVASDVFKGNVNVIKPKRFDGQPNTMYSRLVSAFGFVDPYGQHKYGIPLIPDSYKEYYKEKGWHGIFQSDVETLLTSSRGGGNTASDSSLIGMPQPESPDPASLLPGKKPDVSNSGSSSAGSFASNASGGNSSRSGSSHVSRANRPTPIRMKVLDAPKFNPDGSATFKAKLENHTEVTVFAGKELAEDVRKVRPGLVIKSSGWVREDQLKITLATKNGKIDIETAA